MKKAFITGSTGFLGVEVLKSLVEHTDIFEFLLLVRDKIKAEKKLNEIIKFGSSLNKNIIFLEGDVTKNNFGLSDKDVAIIKSANEVYHLAAEISLSKNKRAQIFATNLLGTKNLLKIYENVDSLDNLFYFSTAYINGRDKEELKEDWLDKKPVFRNPYEESKWLAEQEVKFFLKEHSLPIVILRPTIIATEDKKRINESIKQTIYLYGDILRRAIKLNNNFETIHLIGNNNSNINLITSKDIVQILLKIRSLNKKERIYNLVNKRNLSAHSFLEGLKEALNFNGKFKLVESLDVNLLSQAEKLIYESTKAYFEYNLDTFLQWNTTNSDRIREELSIIPKDDNWLKNHAKEFFWTVEHGK